MIGYRRPLSPPTLWCKRTRGHRLQSGVVVALSTIMLLGLAVRDASAVCPGEYTLFVRHGGPNTALGEGVVTTNTVRDSELAPYCETADHTSPTRHSTAHLRSSDYAFYVEIGWTKWRNTPTTVIWYWFTSWRTDLATKNGPSGPLQCCSTMRWKIYNIPATAKWKMAYDPTNTGQGYILVAQSPAMPFGRGVPFGETGVRGGSGPQGTPNVTNAYDHHWNLKWADTGGDTGWHAWDTNILFPSNLPGWYYQWRANDEYEVLQTCSQPTC